MWHVRVMEDDDVVVAIVSVDHYESPLVLRSVVTEVDGISCLHTLRKHNLLRLILSSCLQPFVQTCIDACTTQKLNANMPHAEELVPAVPVHEHARMR